MERASNLFSAWFYQSWRQRLETDLKTLPADEFIDRRLADVIACRCMDIMNAVPLVPANFLLSKLHYPVHTWDWECEGEHPSQHLSREDVESGRVRVVTLDGKQVDGDMMANNLVYLMDNVVVLDSHRIPQNHWLTPHLIPLDHDDVRVALHGVERICNVGGTNGNYPTAVFCDSITLSHPLLGHAETRSDAFLLTPSMSNVTGIASEDMEAWFDESPSMLVIGSLSNSGAVVRQVYTYDDEYGVADEHYCAQEAASFKRFVMANRPGQELEAIREALIDAGILELSGLHGKRFELSFSGGETSIDSEMAVSLIA